VHHLADESTAYDTDPDPSHGSLLVWWSIHPEHSQPPS
jgi:hypothetical protein